MTARKTTTAKTKVIVRTDAVFADGKHYYYGETVALPEADARKLITAKMAEKA